MVYPLGFRLESNKTDKLKVAVRNVERRPTNEKVVDYRCFESLPNLKNNDYFEKAGSGDDSKIGNASPANGIAPGDLLFRSYE